MPANSNVKLSNEFGTARFDMCSSLEAQAIAETIEIEGAVTECWCPACGYAKRDSRRSCPKCNMFRVETFRKLNIGA